MFVFLLAIIWVYNIIWFIPIDFIKFGLQAVFHRSLHAVKPFEHIRRRLSKSKEAQASVMPMDEAERIAEERREYLKQKPQQAKPLEPIPVSCLPTKVDQITQTGSSFYSPYTDTLSALRAHNPLLRSLSYN